MRAPHASIMWVRSFRSVTCAPPQSSMIAPRENGSLLAPTSWFPSTATMPKGGRSRSSSSTTCREARAWLTMSPVRATRSAPHSTPKSTPFRNARMLSDGVPACRSLRWRIVKPSSSRGRPATPTSSVRHSTHCDSKRPQAAAPTPAAVRVPSARCLLPTHGVELVAQATSRLGDPLAQHAPAVLVARMAVAGRGDRLAPLGQVRGCGNRCSCSEEEGENPAHAGILPACDPQAPPSQSSPALERGEQGLVGGL